MKKRTFLVFSLFLVLSVSDAETLAQGDVTFKGSFNGGYFLLEIAGGKAKISKYPGVYHNNCEICNPNVYPCSTGYDGKRRLGIAGSQCNPLTRPALSAVQKYCTQSCSVNLGDPAPPLPPPPPPPAPPKSNPAPTSTPTPTPKTPSNNYVTFSGSFAGGYIKIKIAAGKANVVMYPGRTYTDCKICEPSIWGCSAGTDGKKRLGTGGSKCSSVPSSAMNFIRSYCAQSCSISSNPPPDKPSINLPTNTLIPPTSPISADSFNVILFPKSPSRDKIPSFSDMPLDSTYTVNVLKRTSSGVPSEFEITDGSTTYSSGCWTCDWCFPQQGSHPGTQPNTGTTYVR